MGVGVADEAVEEGVLPLLAGVSDPDGFVGSAEEDEPGDDDPDNPDGEEPDDMADIVADDLFGGELELVAESQFLIKAIIE